MRNIFRKKNNERSRAFTLVETLIAISILMLSITGPLYFASESLKAAVYARDQITAFYLAQDAFEQIHKIRDDNIYFDGASWYTGLDVCTADKTLCRVNTTGLLYAVAASPSSDDYFLYLNEESGEYSHQSSGGTKTIFQRKVKIEPNDNTDWAFATEMKVTVTIEWSSRGTVRAFTAYEFLRALN
jgi:type II secretory pathway pseudopilin PulG